MFPVSNHTSCETSTNTVKTSNPSAAKLVSDTRIVMRSISPQPTPHLSPTNSADLHLSDAPLLGTMKFNEEQKAFWKTHTRPEVSSKVQKLVMLRTIAHDQEKAGLHFDGRRSFAQAEVDLLQEQLIQTSQAARVQNPLKVIGEAAKNLAQSLGNYFEGMPSIEEAACQGEAKAQFALGLIYEKGKGVKKILDEALKWYSEAAKQGNAEAIRKVAKLKKIGFLSMMMAESDARQHIGYVLKVTIFHIYGNWDILLPYRLYPKGCQPMAISTVFINNRTQAVRLPAEVRLPEGVKHVSVRAIGNERIIAPVENTWDSFFINGPQASEDFLTERASQQQDEREALE